MNSIEQAFRNSGDSKLINMFENAAINIIKDKKRIIEDKRRKEREAAIESKKKKDEELQVQINKNKNKKIWYWKASPEQYIFMNGIVFADSAKEAENIVINNIQQDIPGTISKHQISIIALDYSKEFQQMFFYCE